MKKLPMLFCLVTLSLPAQQAKIAPLLSTQAARSGIFTVQAAACSPGQYLDQVLQ